jgi:hypothetical protein
LAVGSLHTRWQFAGHTLTGQQLLNRWADAVAAQELTRPRTSMMPWWPIRLAAHAGPMPHTPLAAALAATVAQP